MLGHYMWEAELGLTQTGCAPQFLPPTPRLPGQWHVQDPEAILSLCPRAQLCPSRSLLSLPHLWTSSDKALACATEGMASLWATVAGHACPECNHTSPN